jgi:triosephosphate isomerase
MSRVPFICGNWKMHNAIEPSLALVDDIRPRVEGLGSVEVGVAPPFTALHAVKKRIEGSRIRLAAQNCHFERSGAFTGEVSVEMLRDVGCDYVLVGHSERRQLFGETDEGVKKKVEAILEGGLRAIVAIGETLDERDAGRTLPVVLGQLDAALSGLEARHLADVVVAYEPVWAIGTGRTATPEQAQEVHAALRSRLSERFGAEAAGGLRLQYGGSMKPGNAAELLAQADIDGGLIGGAALKAGDFAAICEAAA